MAIVKSKLLKQLSKNWPNIFQKDLEKLIDIILKEIKLSLKRGERVELRGNLGFFFQKFKNLISPETSNKSRSKHAKKKLYTSK